jgi:tRNA (mo5U34)-methyltransferase
LSDTEALRKRVESFSRWHYEFDLGGGVVTPIASVGHRNRHKQRKEYFLTPLVKLCGGTLAGKRVLDLGCNAGYWSLAAIEAGADFVLGIDGRQMHIDQANLVFEAKGVDPGRFRFQLADIYELDLDGEQFDIVLCLGLLYHVSRPFELMERISRWNTDLVVIDTTLDTKVRGAYFRVIQQDLDDPRASLDRPVALHPTWQAVRRLAEQYGYRCAALRPRFTDWHGANRYREGSRRAFLCSKHTDLSGLDPEEVEERPPPRPPADPPPNPPSPPEPAARGVTARLRRLLRRG